LVRAAGRARWPALEVRQADATKRAELGDALRGIDVVANCVGGAPGTMISATAALCDAARRNPPRRIVHLSSMAVYGEACGPVTESTKPEPPLNSYARAKIDCEALIQDYVADGGDAVIVRPTCVFGPNSDQWAGRIARLLLARRLGDLGSLGDGVCNLVHIDDLAALVVGLLGPADVSGEAFNANADEPRPTWNEFFFRFARAIGATPVERFSARRMHWESTFVTPLLRAATLAASPVVRFEPDVITPSLLRLWRQSIDVSNVKGSTILGASYRPLEQAIAETAAWWSTRGREQTRVPGRHPVRSAR
jgi:nucleoside-diphosphate-sugar epimerase